MGCGICAEVCPFESIKMDQVFELSTADRFGTLLLHKEQLAKSNAYFNKIAPVQAAQIDAARAEDVKKAEAKAAAAAEAKAKAAAAAVSNATSGVAAAAAENAVSASPKSVVASQSAPAPLPASSSSKPSQPLPPAKP
jgi:NADH-quinone oxidoreductase subunit I